MRTSIGARRWRRRSCPILSGHADSWRCLWNPGDHDFTLSLLLAGSRRGRGRTGQGPNTGQAQGCDRRGVKKRARRHDRGHVFLEFDHVFHHPDHCRHFTCTRANQHHNRPAGRRSAASTCRQWGLSALHVGPDRHWNAGRAGPGRIVRVCRGGRSRVAGFDGDSLYEARASSTQ